MFFTTSKIFWSFQRKPPSKRKPSEARQKTHSSELLLLQRRLEDRIQLFEKEKEMESTVIEKVRKGWKDGGRTSFVTLLNYCLCKPFLKAMNE